MKKLNVLLLGVAIVLFVALLDMSRDYYQFLRWSVFIIGLVSAFMAYKQKKIIWMVALGTMAILFNPFAPLQIHRDTWRILYTAGGALCLVGSFMVELKL